MRVILPALASLLVLSACTDYEQTRIKPENEPAAPSLADTFRGSSEVDEKADALQQATEVENDAEPAAGDSQASAGATLNNLFDQYFLASLERNPFQGTFIGMRQYNDRWVNPLSPDYIAETRTFTRNWLDRIREIDRSALNTQDQISYDIFVYNQEQTLEGMQWPRELMPVSQFFSIPNFMATMGSGQSVQPFATVEDYDNWLSRAEGIPVILDQAITNMKKGVEQGYVQPRVVMEKTLPQLAAQVVDDPEQSIFWMPVGNMPEDFSDSERERLTAAYRTMIADDIIPAYRRLHDYIAEEYMPETREVVGLHALPDGRDMYDFQIESNTTTELSADEIHEFGLSEVARIRGEMEGVMDEVGFEGSLEEFFVWLKEQDRFYFEDEEALLQGYRDLQDKVNEKLPALFNIEPRADYEVRAVEAFRAQSAAGASYQSASPDGSRPGVFYVNTYNLRAQPKYGMETLSLHEASPGHHFQIAIQQEIEDLPPFRRFGGFTAFSEGWALYAESLGKEMGMFEDPYQYFGRLSDEMLRAIRLVVDTGMHDREWTREQAIEYFRANSDMADSDIVAEVERYIAIPGQALAYKVGQRVIRNLRNEAEAELGEDFDVKEFHRVVLTGGAMPMEILKRRVRNWVDSVSASG